MIIIICDSLHWYYHPLLHDLLGFVATISFVHISEDLVMVSEMINLVWEERDVDLIFTTVILILNWISRVLAVLILMR